MHKDLNLTEPLISEIKQSLNIIINCAATIDMKVKVDMAVRTNVTGPIKLLRLAQSSPNAEAFVQVSTCYVNCDRTGYIEETIYQNKLKNWTKEYERVTRMSKH